MAKTRCHKCRYNKRSLQQDVVEAALLLSENLVISPLPPVYKDVFTSNDHESVSAVISHVVGNTDQVLLPHKVCYAIKINDFVIGASKSKVLRSSLVIVKSQPIRSGS